MGWTATVPSLALAGLSTLNSYVTSDQFKAVLNVIDVPKSVTISIAVLGVLVLIARGHED